MTQPNKYHHPILGLSAVINKYGDYECKDLGNLDTCFDKKYIEALGFKPVEEEKENDWIDDSYDNLDIEIEQEDWIDNICREILGDNIYGKGIAHLRMRSIIEKHLPKQGLIPLDLEKIKDEILLLTTSRYTCTRVREAWNYNTMDRDDFIPLGEDDDFMDDIKQILSKYGTTPQKKRNEQEIRNMYYYTSSQNNDYNINDTLAPGIIITFLRKVGLLQE